MSWPASEPAIHASTGDGDIVGRNSIRFSVALMALMVGGAVKAEQKTNSTIVVVRMLPNGNYLYKGKEITARDLVHLRDDAAKRHEEIEISIPKDRLAKDRFVKQMLEEAKRSGATHIGFSGITEVPTPSDTPKKPQRK
jgi:hypothetical protein